MPASSASPDSATTFRLDGKVALITGGAGFLGSHYCRAFAEAGATVIVADLDQAQCDGLSSEINAKRPESAVPLAVDLAREQSVQAMAEVITAKFGAVDIILNNAATKSPNFFAPLESFPLADWEHVMAVNVTGMFLVVRALGPAMAARKRGSIINVSSIYGVVGPDQRIYEGSYLEKLGGPINTPLVYSVSKGAVLALTRYLATYWGSHGVRSNTLTPGGIESGQNAVFVERYTQRVPLGRMGKPIDLVGAALFLASDSSSYINGQNLIVDGGLTAW